MSLAPDFMPQLPVNRARKRDWPYGNIEGSWRAHSSIRIRVTDQPFVLIHLDPEVQEQRIRESSFH